MKLDVESLYVFGGILLDQWSLQAITVGSVSLNKKHPFSELVWFFENNADHLLSPLWNVLKEQILWLYYQVRFYRNRFVVHVNRPWQRGTNRSFIGDGFKLFTPNPPGWLEEAKFRAAYMSIVHLIPDILNKLSTEFPRDGQSIMGIIEKLFSNIGSISKREDREKVAEIFGKIGGSTPTFQVIARNLFEFVENGTGILIELAKTNMRTINIGPPTQ